MAKRKGKIFDVSDEPEEETEAPTLDDVFDPAEAAEMRKAQGETKPDTRSAKAYKAFIRRGLDKKPAEKDPYLDRMRSKAPNVPPGCILVKDAQAGTVNAFMHALYQLRIECVFNTFSGVKFVRIPEHFEDDTDRVGKLVPLDKELKAAVVAIVQRDAVALTEKGDMRPVRLSRADQSIAFDAMFEQNRIDPVREYIFDVVRRTKTSRRRILARSMEMGGMKIDAGPFTDAVQIFPWLFFVRNVLFPGSERREHIILHGPKNCGKSAFVKNILPRHLRSYQHGGFDLTMTKKEQIENMKGMAIVEAAEVNRGARGGIDWNAFKAWTSDSKPVTRLSYRENAESHTLAATVIFTTNEPVLPPNDVAASSRLIWANVETPADRRFASKSDTKGRCWAYLDDPFDPGEPECGTWREQYIAQAFAVVRKATIEETTPEGDKSNSCDNPPWLPRDYAAKLDAWNERCGGSVVTDFSELIDEIVEAIKTIREVYTDRLIVDDEACFFAVGDIQSAIYWNRKGKPFVSMYALKETDEAHLEGASVHQVRSAIEKTATGKRLGNARSEVARKLEETVNIGVRGVSPFDPRARVRGWGVGEPF